MADMSQCSDNGELTHEIRHEGILEPPAHHGGFELTAAMPVVMKLLQEAIMAFHGISPPTVHRPVLEYNVFVVLGKMEVGCQMTIHCRPTATSPTVTFLCAVSFLWGYRTRSPNANSRTVLENVIVVPAVVTIHLEAVCVVVVFRLDVRISAKVLATPTCKQFLDCRLFFGGICGSLGSWGILVRDFPVDLPGDVQCYWKYVN